MTIPIGDKTYAMIIGLGWFFTAIVIVMVFVEAKSRLRAWRIRRRWGRGAR